MSENSLKCRNKFFNKVLNKISALKDDFDLLHKVDRKIYRNISRNISSQVGGVPPSLVDAQLAQFYLTKDIADLQKRLAIDFGMQMQDIIDKHTDYITDTDKTVKGIGTNKIVPLLLTNEELDVYMNIIIPFNIPRDLLPELFNQKVTEETHVKYYNEYCARHQIKDNHNIPVKSIDSILTHLNNNNYNDFNANAKKLFETEIDGLLKNSNTNIWEYIFKKLLTIYGDSEESKFGELSKHMMILYYYMVGKKIRVPDTSVLMNEQMQIQIEAHTLNTDPLSHIIKEAIVILDDEDEAPVPLLSGPRN